MQYPSNGGNWVSMRLFLRVVEMEVPMVRPSRRLELVHFESRPYDQLRQRVCVSLELTVAVEADVAVADGAVEDGLLRRDAGRDHRPAVRHVSVTRLRHGRRLTAACEV